MSNYQPCSTDLVEARYEKRGYELNCFSDSQFNYIIIIIIIFFFFTTGTRIFLIPVSASRRLRGRPKSLLLSSLHIHACSGIA
jgi:hypothetical protein